MKEVFRFLSVGIAGTAAWMALNASHVAYSAMGISFLGVQKTLSFTRKGKPFIQLCVGDGSATPFDFCAKKIERLFLLSFF